MNCEKESPMKSLHVRARANGRARVVVRAHVRARVRAREGVRVRAQCRRRSKTATRRESRARREMAPCCDRAHARTRRLEWRRSEERGRGRCSRAIEGASKRRLTGAKRLFEIKGVHRCAQRKTRLSADQKFFRSSYVGSAAIGLRPREQPHFTARCMTQREKTMSKAR
eukprot:4626204-Pleurochrysis_carterae.AAC.2